MESEGSPATDPDLVFMTRLMQLAVGARTMLRDKSYAFPVVSNDLLKTFFPILSTFILEVQLREPDEADGAPPPPPPLSADTLGNVRVWGKPCVVSRLVPPPLLPCAQGQG